MEPQAVEIIFEDRPILRVTLTFGRGVIDYELRSGQLLNLARQALKAHDQLRSDTP